jgi:hypothetical protein
LIIFLWKKTKDWVRFPIWKLAPHSISVFVNFSVSKILRTWQVSKNIASS